MAIQQEPENGWGTRWLAFVGLVGLVVVALVTITDVLLRWLFSMPVDGVSEISRLVVAVSIASFFPMALSDRHHISIEFLGAALGPRARLWLDTLAHLVTALFFLVLGWQFILYTLEISESGETTWLLGWNVTPWWAVTTVFMLICIPIQALIFWHQIRAALRGDVLPPPSDKFTDAEY
ncbi:MAG: TRAP transporter small permease [Rhodospirillales bacterium]|nr:TRAP transporter small permease [Rhodospirillales bacterium]